LITFSLSTKRSTSATFDKVIHSLHGIVSLRGFPLILGLLQSFTLPISTATCCSGEGEWGIRSTLSPKMATVGLSKQRSTLSKQRLTDLYVAFDNVASTLSPVLTGLKGCGNKCGFGLGIGLGLMF